MDRKKALQKIKLGLAFLKVFMYNSVVRVMDNIYRGVNAVANIKSAIKRAGTNKKENLRNREDKSALKTALRRYDEALQGEDKEAAEAAYLKAVSTVDKAAAKGVIHKNAANHKKAQLAGKRASAN